MAARSWVASWAPEGNPGSCGLLGLRGGSSPGGNVLTGSGWTLGAAVCIVLGSKRSEECTSGDMEKPELAMAGQVYPAGRSVKEQVCQEGAAGGTGGPVLDGETGASDPWLTPGVPSQPSALTFGTGDIGAAEGSAPAQGRGSPDPGPRSPAQPGLLSLAGGGPRVFRGRLWHGVAWLTGGGVQIRHWGLSLNQKEHTPCKLQLKNNQEKNPADHSTKNKNTPTP